ncbi:MAG: hypothetical protein FJ296_09220 [Planctomycetes bacterium]|nr:hypothetical protein [Planctomycetota bacterium]
MDLLNDFLKTKGPEVSALLTGKLGFSADQAKGFLPPAAQKLFETVKAGGLDMNKLLGGDVSQLLAKVDAGALGQALGLDSAKAGSGLKAIADAALSMLKDKGGLAGLVGDKGGALGQAAGLAGKLFGKG